MKPNDPREDLLNDLFTGDDGPPWSDAALARVRSAARQRRVLRRVRHGLGTAVTLMLLAAAGWFFSRPGAETPGTLARRPLVPQVVDSNAATTDSVRFVHSQPLAPAETVQSSARHTVLVRTEPGAFPLLRSGAPVVHPLTDEELLRLAGNSAVLVRHDTGDMELLFARPSPSAAPGN